MLILTRSQYEMIVINDDINDDIKATIISNRNGQVKLGIEAPKAVKVWREEIYDQLLADDFTTFPLTEN